MYPFRAIKLILLEISKRLRNNSVDYVIKYESKCPYKQLIQSQTSSKVIRRNDRKTVDAKVAKAHLAYANWKKRATSKS
jgi:hypothetical protein